MDELNPVAAWRRVWSAAHMDGRAALAAFDEQIRRRRVAGPTDGVIEREATVVRSVSTGDEWSGVTWSGLDDGLDDGDVDAVIAAQVERFARTGRPWEWTYFSYDRPADLPERLAAAGLEPEGPEALMIAEAAELALDVPPPDGVELVPVADAEGVAALVALHDEVFGGDHAKLGRVLLSAIERESDSTVAVLAMAGDTPVSGARVEFVEGTDFAGLWGGGTLAAWRGRGVFRALVSYRAALAAARGYRYLHVEASPDSRPILRRLGFAELATATPFAHPGPG